jgi:hypothetical protein
MLSASVLVLLFALTVGFAQEQATESNPPEAVPVATQTEVECSGFLAPESIAKNIVLFNGADNDHFQRLRQFKTGDIVYLRLNEGTTVTVGSEYRLVRRAKEQFRTGWYPAQWWTVASLGRMYEDVGRLRVTQITDNGVIAEVTYSCGAIYAGDIAIPYQARPVPEYVPTVQGDRYAPANGKLVGSIVAARANTPLLATGSLAFLNIGSTDGVHPGQRYRIFRTFKDRSSLLPHRKTPRETTGEIVILSTESKSAVGVVVNSIREVALRDGVELE